MFNKLRERFWLWVWHQLEISEFVEDNISVVDDALRNELVSNHDLSYLERKVEQLESRIQELEALLNV